MDWSDSELSQAIRTGNPDAEAELCRRYYDRILRMTQRALSGGPDFSDLAHEVLQGVLLNLRQGRFQGKSKLGTYIYAITRNKVAEYYRRRRDTMTELKENLPDSGPSPEDGVTHDEVSRVLGDILDHLQPKYRNVLYEYYFRGLNISEISVKLGVPPRKVSGWKDYALKVLRSRFGADLKGFR